jgi:hypothetical protein
VTCAGSSVSMCGGNAPGSTSISTITTTLNQVAEICVSDTRKKTVFIALCLQNPMSCGQFENLLEWRHANVANSTSRPSATRTQDENLHNVRVRRSIPPQSARYRPSQLDTAPVSSNCTHSRHSTHSRHYTTNTADTALRDEHSRHITTRRTQPTHHYATALLQYCQTLLGF